MDADDFIDFTDARLAGVTRRCLRSNDNPALRISWVLACMHECIRSHDNCQIPGSVALPLRLIDVGFGSDSQIIQLLESQDLESRNVRYVALSHCWGTSTLPLTTTRESLAARMNGIKREELPPTFRGVVDLCRSLGFQFLWIDSLCIVQDNKSEWASESSKMAEIYRGATLTVAASAHSDSSKGLSIHQGTARIEPSTGESRKSAFIDFEHRRLDGSKIILEPFYISVSVATKFLWPHWSSPLQHRAWALQERALSTRKIFCDGTQLLWECKEKRYLEGWCIEPHHLTYPSDPAMSKFNSVSIPPRPSDQANLLIENARGNMTQIPRSGPTHDQWLEILHEFGQRKLTFSQDALPAMSGLAKHFSLCHNDVYLAGIWSHDLPRGLAWVRWWDLVEGGSSNRYKYYIETKASSPKSIDNCYAPSWSWASLQESFESTTWRTSELSKKLPSVRLESFDVAPLYLDVYGQLRRARIELSGYGCSLWVKPRDFASHHPYGQYPGLFIFELDRLKPLSLNQYLHPILDHPSWLKNELRANEVRSQTYELCCLLLGGEGHLTSANDIWHCLLLYLTKEDPNTYKRCGIMTISAGHHWPMWKDLESFWREEKFVIV